MLSYEWSHDHLPGAARRVMPNPAAAAVVSDAAAGRCMPMYGLRSGPFD